MKFPKLQLPVLLFLLISTSLFAQLPKLKIADNNRFLVKANGSPFVWIGETNWFFAKLPPTTIDKILEKRSEQGYTVMMVSCREKLYNGEDPGPIDKPNEAWWSYLDEYIAKCEQKGIYVAITLGWWGKAMRASENELFAYGKWVGERYKDKNNIIWLTLGEAGGYSRKKELPEEKIKALVKGIRDGDTGNKLLTVHADYKRATSISNISKICDFNNWQTSQWCCLTDLPRKDDRNWTVWEAITYDYHQIYNGNPKPTIDLEAWYENNKDFCGTTSFNIRRRAYFTIFAGAFGHSYGAGGIWDGLNEKDSCSSTALQAINYQGAKEIGYLSNFLHRLRKNFLKLRPDQSIIVDGNSANYDTHIQAAVANDNSFALIYSASDQPYLLDISKLKGKSLPYFWYNPRTNEYKNAGKVKTNKASKSLEFDPPGEAGPGNDWVLGVGNILMQVRNEFQN